MSANKCKPSGVWVFEPDRTALIIENQTANQTVESPPRKKARKKK